MVLSTFVGVLAARMLLPEGRGALALIVSMAGIGVLLSALGSNVAVRRLLPRHENVTVRGYWRLTHRLLAVLAVVQLVLFLGVTEFTDLERAPGTLAVFLAYALALFYANQSVDLLYAHGLPSVATRTHALGTLVTLCFVLICYLGGFALIGVASAYVAGSAAKVLFAHLILRRPEMRDGESARGEWALTTSGLRLLGMTLGQNLTSRADTLLLGALSVPAQVGFYAVATTPASLLRLPATAVGQVMMHDAASGKTMKRMAFSRVGTVLALSLPLALLGALSADWLIPLVFGAPFEGAVEAFRILLGAELCFLPFLVLSRYVAASGNVWGASSSGLAGIVVLVAICIWLVPSKGAVGAALASVAAYSVMSAISVFWAMKVKEHGDATT